MQIIYTKSPTDEQNKQIMNMSLSLGLSFDTARLLFCRGYDSVAKAERFLNPGKKYFNSPFLLTDMQEIVSRITTARDYNENVLIFGDYDADGVCATTVLYRALKEFGINARCIIPEREHGYGLNLDLILPEHEKQPIDLIITVDCGISDGEKVLLLQEKGIEVIVTDHHEPPEILPPCLKINPKIKGQAYPFDGLCGAGVAYKLGVALIGEKANELLDFVALATVADSMDLIEENRDIVTEGLKSFNKKTVREQFKYLLGETRGEITAQTLAYAIAPKVNAGGRMGNANCSLNMFLSENPTEIYEYAVKLNEYNLMRQAQCDVIYRQAKDQIKENGYADDDVILVANEQWGTGFVGIVASRLVEEYARPVIVFAGHEGYYKGSARSIDGINIFEALSSQKDKLITYGGHAQAAGVAVEKENFTSFRESLNTYVRQCYGKLDVSKKVYAEWDFEEELSTRFARELGLLEPFGVGNRKPLFTTTVRGVKSLPLRQGSPHYTFKTKAVEMLDFNGGANVSRLSLPIEKKIIFEPNFSVYNKKEYVKGYVKGIVEENLNFNGLKYLVFENNLKAILSEQECEVLSAEENGVDFSKRGTVYFLSDLDNLKRYDKIQDLPVYLFQADGKWVNSCVILSPVQIPEGFSRCVYLDKPIAFLNNEYQNYCFNGVNGYSVLNEISVERSQMAECYTQLLTWVGKSFSSIYDMIERGESVINEYQLIFATAVFIELGFFSVIDGVLHRNPECKNALTNSKVYSKISLLKGE